MTLNHSPSFGILLIDDETPFLRSLSIALERSAGFNHLFHCEDSRQAMQIIKDNPIGLVLLDLTMPYLSGEDLLQQIIEEHPDISVIIISGLNQLETALHCIRLGAYDYFVKTTEESRLIEGIRRAVRMQEMQQENQIMRQHLLTDTLVHPQVFADIVTGNKSMRSIFQYLESIAISSQPVLICGESGVGKEQIAQAVHTLSARGGPIVSVNVAGLDDNVFADTLFGHNKGAFTGASNARSGMIEQAKNGTLFLDEIGDLSLVSQVKLLRLLQEGEYYPLGSDRAKKIHARIIVATHQNLETKLHTGEFRKDLYYRLKVHQVDIPPLRQRKDDIPLLLEHFLTEAAHEFGKTKPTIPKELILLLENYSFPGNVRELKALIYDAMSQHQAKILSMEVFRRALGSEITLPSFEEQTDNVIFKADSPLPSLQEMSDLLVKEAMNRAQGNQSLACRLLGISQPALSKRLKKSPKQPL